MEKKDIIAFFDRCAPWWDDDMIRNEEIIATILDNGGIAAGMDVLDVACGTGVLFPDYLGRNVRSVTGIDISPEMAKIAAAKFPQVTVLCDDVETAEFDKTFDAIMDNTATIEGQITRALCGIPMNILFVAIALLVYFLVKRKRAKKS